MTYHTRRQHPDAPNDPLEKPVITEAVDAPAGKRVLDLGCGDAALGRVLLELGAAPYVGVKDSSKMAMLAAQTLEGMGGSGVKYHRTLEDCYGLLQAAGLCGRTARGTSAAPIFSGLAGL